MKAMKEKEMTYEKAMERLEEISSQLENNKLGIDQIAGCLKEAKALAAFCREQLVATEEDVRKILADKE